ncbi:MAG: hypothetical protein LBC82_01375 [Oscillospiraceae bacterium]|jgi:hypothetical protein|nr:hypothetical protein [Oscillospiraceae bacterium]
MTVTEIKMDFTQTVKIIRETDIVGAKYPKATKGAKQRKNGTDTVHCGYGNGSWHTAETVLHHTLFRKFLDRSGAVAKIEVHYNTLGQFERYRIRINYDIQEDVSCQK